MITLRVNEGSVYYESFGYDYYDVYDWYNEEYATEEEALKVVEDLKKYYKIYSIETYKNKIVVNTY